MSQVEVRQLVKEYKRRKNSQKLGQALRSMFAPDYEVLRAVDSVDFSIEEGEAVGYVGPNGSGKSTTIKMLCGILKPTQGSVKINGLDPFKDRVRNSKGIGAVFGNRSLLWWDVPVIESYRLFQKLYDIPEKRFQENLEKFTLAGKEFHEGDAISIDGTTGNIYDGVIPTVDAQIAGEFGRIMAWADKYRRLKVRTNADTPSDAKKAVELGAEGIGLCRTEHM